MITAEDRQKLQELWDRTEPAPREPGDNATREEIAGYAEWFRAHGQPEYAAAWTAAKTYSHYYDNERFIHLNRELAVAVRAIELHEESSED